MKRTWRNILGGCIAAVIVSAPYPAPARPAVPAAPAVIAGDSFTKYKKVHLVRPDLLSYPLLNEYVC